MKRKRWFSALLTVVIVLGAAGLALMPAQARDRPPDEPPVPHSLALAPARAEGPVPGPHRVVATVWDRDRNPLENVEVSFVVTGAHRVTGRAVTDRRGQAFFSYRGIREGMDTIVAFADGFTARATMRWYVPVVPVVPVPVPTRILLAPVHDTNPVGSSHTVVATVLDAAGRPVSGVEVSFEVTGANPATGRAVTDENGRAGFSYQGTLGGTDTITATARGHTVTVTKWWVVRVTGPLRIELTQTKDRNPVGSIHTVEATVHDGGRPPQPLRGVRVTFRVESNNAATGEAVTDENGRAVFSYQGTREGTDTITATTWRDEVVVGPVRSVTKRWYVPRPAPATGKTDGQGNFAVPLPFPGATASGRLVDPQGRPLPDRDFTLLLVLRGAAMASPEDIVEFTVLVAGYIEITVTRFSRFSLFGLTSFLLGDVRLTAAP